MLWARKVWQEKHRLVWRRKNRSASFADKTKKELHKVFEQFGLKITAEANLYVVNFLNVTFDLTTGTPN